MFRRRKRNAEVRALPGASMLVGGTLRLDVTAFAVHDGTIEIIATGTGPSDAASGYATLIGSDGQGVLQIAYEVSVPALRPGQDVKFTQPLSVSSIEPPDRPSTVHWH